MTKAGRTAGGPEGAEFKTNKKNDVKKKKVRIKKETTMFEKEVSLQEVDRSWFLFKNTNRYFEYR